MKNFLFVSFLSFLAITFSNPALAAGSIPNTSQEKEMAITTMKVRVLTAHDRAIIAHMYGEKTNNEICQQSVDLSLDLLGIAAIRIMLMERQDAIGENYRLFSKAMVVAERGLDICFSDL